MPFYKSIHVYRQLQLISCMAVQFTFIDDGFSAFHFYKETNFDDTEGNVYVCLLQCTAVKKQQPRIAIFLKTSEYPMQLYALYKRLSFYLSFC